MKNMKRQRLLVQIAKLYYEEGYGQEKISQILDLSRPYVSKLLNAAREEGIVRIQVIDPLNVESALEQEFRERFGLLKAIIVPRDNEVDSLTHVAEAGVRYLDSILEDGSVIATSWGRTLHACSRVLTARPDLRDLVSAQICGGVSDVSHTVYASDIAKNFSRNLGTSAYTLTAPAVVGSREVGDLLKNDLTVARVFHYTNEAKIALFTAGAFGMGSALYRAGFLNEKEMHQLEKRGAVGDVCSHVININGEICDSELDERTIALPLDALKKKEYRICVGEGFGKADSMIGALRGGLVNVLVTNEETAERMLERLDSLNFR